MKDGDADESGNQETSGTESKQGLLGRSPWKPRRSEFDSNYIQALVAGSLTVVLFLVVSEALSSTEGQEGLRIAIAAIFIGLSFGYYLGVASQKGTSVATFFIIGLLATLAVLVLIQASIDTTLYILTLASADIFLIYNSGLIDSHPRIEAWVNNGKNLSWVVLAGLLFLQFAPALWKLLLEVQIRTRQAIEFITGLSDRGFGLLLTFAALSVVGFVLILGVLKSFGVFQLRPWGNRRK